METSRLTVEYLIIGILVSIAILFLFVSTSPMQVQALWSTFLEHPDLINAGVVLMSLPVFYGVGIVIEYLGMFMFDGFLTQIKERRFQKFIAQNLDWICRSRLLSRFINNGTPEIPEGSGQLMYGQMRFFVLMNNTYLYEEIKAQINRYRILRALIIVEGLFIVGFLVRFLNKRVDSVSIFFGIFTVVLLVVTIRGLMDRYNRYCRAVEHSFKALALDEFRAATVNRA